MSRDNENMFPYSPSIIDTEAKHFRELKMKKLYMFPVANTFATTRNRLSLRLSPIKKCLKCTHSPPLLPFRQRPHYQRNNVEYDFPSCPIQRKKSTKKIKKLTHRIS